MEKSEVIFRQKGWYSLVIRSDMEKSFLWGSDRDGKRKNSANRRKTIFLWNPKQNTPFILKSRLSIETLLFSIKPSIFQSICRDPSSPFLNRSAGIRRHRRSSFIAIFRQLSASPFSHRRLRFYSASALSAASSSYSAELSKAHGGDLEQSMGLNLDDLTSLTAKSSGLNTRSLQSSINHTGLLQTSGLNKGPQPSDFIAPVNSVESRPHSSHRAAQSWEDSLMADTSPRTDTSTDVDTDDRGNQKMDLAVHGSDSNDRSKEKNGDQKTLCRLAQNREAARKSRLRKKADSKAKPLHHVGIRNYDKLCIIFGSDQANGNLSYKAHDEVPLRQINLDSGTQGDTSDAHEYMNVDSNTPYEAAHNEYPSSGGAGAASGGGQSSGIKHDKARPQAGQKRRRSLPRYDKYDDTLLLMAEAANNMSISVKELTSTLKKPALPRLLGILKGIPELSYGDITRAMIVFGRDLSAADILVSMEEGMRYEFVRNMLG